MEKCRDCGTEITIHDSNVSGVCVDCQEYNYYHQEPQPEAQPRLLEVPVKNKLFKCRIKQLDGEREYSYTEYVVAPTQELAERHFEQEILGWFGDNTKLEDNGWVWDSSWEVAAKIEFISEAEDIQVPGYDGQTHMVGFNLLCCST